MISKRKIVKDLIGCLLGDGCLVRNRIVIGNKVDHIDYVKYKRDYFLKNGLNVSKIYYSNNNTFCSFNVEIPKPYRKWFKHERYHTVKGKRFISKFLLRMISSYGFLLYYLDDGSLYRRQLKTGEMKGLTMSFSIGSYSYSNCEVIRKCLSKKLGIDFKLVKCGDHYKLRTHANGFRAFVDMNRDYIEDIPECMMYKFDTKYKMESLKPYTLEYFQVERNAGITRNV